MFVCINCKRGLMDPIRSEDEPEYTDRYQCGHCGHTATIVSRLIVLSQLFSAILGGAITLYLLLGHLGAVLGAWQSGQNQSIAQNLGLTLVAVILMAGFGYTLYRAGLSMHKRQRYLHRGR